MIELRGTTAGPSTIGFDNTEEEALLELFDADNDGRMSASELHTLKWMLSRIHEGHEVRCQGPELHTHCCDRLLRVLRRLRLCFIAYVTVPHLLQ